MNVTLDQLSTPAAFVLGVLSRERQPGRMLDVVALAELRRHDLVELVNDDDGLWMQLTAAGRALAGAVDDTKGDAE
jgi:hypothetical protein